MTLRNIKISVRNVEEKSFTTKDGEIIKFIEGYFGGDEFDSFTKFSCNKVVPDGVYNCALKVEFDFNKRVTKTKVFIGVSSL